MRYNSDIRVFDLFIRLNTSTAKNDVSSETLYTVGCSDNEWVAILCHTSQSLTTGPSMGVTKGQYIYTVEQAILINNSQPVLNVKKTIQVSSIQKSINLNKLP